MAPLIKAKSEQKNTSKQPKKIRKSFQNKEIFMHGTPSKIKELKTLGLLIKEIAT